MTVHLCEITHSNNINHVPKLNVSHLFINKHTRSDIVWLYGRKTHSILVLHSQLGTRRGSETVKHLEGNKMLEDKMVIESGPGPPCSSLPPTNKSPELADCSQSED